MENLILDNQFIVEKRFDEHCKNNIQFIDQMIEFDGIENYTFEILKEVSKPELCYWEDYFILKFKTFYPEGYNKKWNCNEEIRKEILEEIEKEKNKEKQIEEKRKEIVEKKYNDNDLWVEFFFDYKLFSFLLLFIKEQC